MNDVIKEMIREDMMQNMPTDLDANDLDRMIEQTTEQDDISMFVLSNRSKQNGAVSMIFKDVLEEFADKHLSDLYIIPSSIHEALLVKINNNHETLIINNMIKDVNQTIREDEILSDHIYVYHRETKQITY